MESKATYRGECGRIANVMFEPMNGSRYIVKMRSVNGALTMWEPREFFLSEYKGGAREALAEAKEAAKEFAEGSPTNIERVAYLMNYSEAGPLIQAFVMQALESYADAVIKGGAEKCDSPMVSGAAWVRCAQDVKAKLA